MPKRILIPALFLFAPILFAQLDSNSVTVTAIHNVTQSPDQASFAIAVSSSLNTSLDDVLSALQGSGITLANFTGLSAGRYGQSPDQPDPYPLSWAFSLTVPVAKVKDTVAVLNNLQQAIPKKNSALQFSFFFQSTGVSIGAQAQGCVLADLIADGRAQAQRLAAAAGLSAGAVLAMSSVVLSVDGVTGAPGVPGIGYGCSLMIKFALVRS